MSIHTRPGGDIALYHQVQAHEDFHEAAQALFHLVQYAQTHFPGAPRQLFLEITGHRNAAGGFDQDMYELQTHFLLGFLGRFLTAMHCPLTAVTNSQPQENAVPPALDIQAPGPPRASRVPHARGSKGPKRRR